MACDLQWPHLDAFGRAGACGREQEAGGAPTGERREVAVDVEVILSAGIHLNVITSIYDRIYL